ncbi:nucleolin-like isoform X2 [Phaenicophaeus curvirostris]|uniref:nucleolin-like isoform X2 n=1 Tax=Phaenicophaeus curvirostris TaxID=33595 RepID=UPI0037F0BD6E
MPLMRDFHLSTCSQRLRPHQMMKAWRKRMLILKEVGPLAAQPYPQSEMEPKRHLRRIHKAMPAAKIVKESKCRILQMKALLRGFWLFNIMLEAVKMAATKAGWRKDLDEDEAMDKDVEMTMDVEMEEVEEKEEEMWIDPPPPEQALQRCGAWLRVDESEEGERYGEDEEDDEDEDYGDEDDEDEDDEDEGYETEDFEDMDDEDEDDEDEDDEDDEDEGYDNEDDEDEDDEDEDDEDEDDEDEDEEDV